MARKEDEIRRYLDRLRHGDTPGIVGRVVSVDEGAFTCDVEKSAGVVYQDVRLRAISDGDEHGLVAIPQRGSHVLIARMDDGEYYVAMHSTVDRLQLAIGNTLLTATDKGFRLDRQAAGLRKTLSDLCDALGRLTVTTAVGASGPPINITEFQKIRKELDQYLEQ